MIFEDFLEAFLGHVRLFVDVDCSEYRILLVLCITAMVIMACMMLVLLRRDDSSSERSYAEARDDATEVWGQERWQSHEWQVKVRQSCQVQRDGGIVVLVTGAAGFLGLHICLALKARGDGVVGLDNFCSGPDHQLKRKRQAQLEENSVFVTFGDINDSNLLKKLFDLVPFTHVMHLAAQTNIRTAAEDPGAFVYSNISGLVKLLEVCRRANPQPAFIWASSNSVYGLNTSVPYLESDRSDQPASLYAASKKAGEGLVHVYNHRHGLSTTTLRLGTVYGPWGRPDMAYWVFARDIIRGKEITIYQGPNQADLARDWTFIDDIVQGCLAAIDTAGESIGGGRRKTRSAEFRTFNLGCPSPVTINNLLNIVEGHLQIPAKVRVVEMPSNSSSPFMYSDISLAKLQLGYNPVTDPYTGLKKFVDWYLDYHGISESVFS